MHLEKSSRFEHFTMSWVRLLIQAAIVLFSGVILSLASFLNPSAVVMSARFFSWLPLCGAILLILGILECIDAFLSQEQRDFFQNLQVGVLDSVTGALLILSISDSPERLGLMIAAFLIVRGIVRIVLTLTLHLPQIIPTTICGVVSVLTGILVFLQWPTSASWFSAFCLSLEIAFRGWAMMMFALWVRVEQQQNE